MDNRYIVAIEIGSSKIKGLAATVGTLGDINVIAIEECKVNNSVRYGNIRNVQEVSAHVNDILRKLENNPLITPRKISEVFVAMGGRTLSVARAQAKASFPNAIEISAETISRLEREASFDLVTDKTTLQMLPHTFYVDNSETRNVVGTVGTQLRAEFSAVVISPISRRNLEMVKFGDRNPTRHYVVRPIVLSDLLLTSSEKQLGCALVDFGAETTTITVFKNDVLQTIVTLPIGSRNITRDLMVGLSMTEDNAETAKSATPADAVTSTDVEINNYINARAGEIIANILHQLEAAGYRAQSLPAGIILTGGGSKLRGFDRMLEAQSKMAVRLASLDGAMQFKGSGFDRTDNADLLAVARYAADKTDANCLTPLPETEETGNQDEYGYTAPGERHSGYGPRHVDYDDDSLLEDDSDDVEKDELPTVRAGRTKGKNPGQKPKPQPVDDYDNDYSDDYDEDDDDEPEGIGLVGRIKSSILKFMTKPEPGEDDLDAPVN